MCAFQAHKFKDVTRSQLYSALRCLNKATASDLRGADKASLAKPLAAAFIKEKIIEIVPWAKLENVKNSEVEKVGTKLRQ